MKKKIIYLTLLIVMGVAAGSQGSSTYEPDPDPYWCVLECRWNFEACYSTCEGDIDCVQQCIATYEQCQIDCGGPFW